MEVVDVFLEFVVFFVKFTGMGGDDDAGAGGERGAEGGEDIGVVAAYEHGIRAGHKGF